MQIEYTKAGRPKRRSTKDVSYKSIYGNDGSDSDEFDFDCLREKAEEERCLSIYTLSSCDF